MRARIDISEIEAETKIRAKYLRALENEEWDLLPGPDVRQELPAHLRRLPRASTASCSSRSTSCATSASATSSCSRSPRPASASAGAAPRRPASRAAWLVGVVVVVAARRAADRASATRRRRRRQSDAARTPPTATASRRTTHDDQDQRRSRRRRRRAEPKRRAADSSSPPARSTCAWWTARQAHARSPGIDPAPAAHARARTSAKRFRLHARATERAADAVNGKPRPGPRRRPTAIGYDDHADQGRARAARRRSAAPPAAA